MLPIAVRALRLGDSWQAARPALQAWVEAVANTLTGQTRLAENGYAEIVELPLTVGVTVGPVIPVLLSRVATPPAGVFICKIVDRDAPSTPVKYPAMWWIATKTGIGVTIDVAGLVAGRTYLVSFFVIGA